MTINRIHAVRSGARRLASGWMGVAVLGAGLVGAMLLSNALTPTDAAPNGLAKAPGQAALEPADPTASDSVLAYRQALVNIDAALARHDGLSAARFRAALAGLSTPPVIAAVAADRRRLLTNLAAATDLHEWRMVALFRDQLEVYGDTFRRT